MHPKLFEYFKICDEGRYLAKQEFYNIKKEILMAEGIPDGFDIRLVHKKNKLGPVRETHYLRRYKLNDEIFHLASNKIIEGKPVKIINGFTETETDLHRVYHALVVLMLNYAPERINKIADHLLVQKLLRNADRLQQEIYNDFKEAVNQ